MTSWRRPRIQHRGPVLFRSIRGGGGPITSHLGGGGGEGDMSKDVSLVEQGEPVIATGGEARGWSSIVYDSEQSRNTTPQDLFCS